ncbi:hypothetical protein ALC62_00338, partial [Cyphomyrmex costatus]
EKVVGRGLKKWRKGRDEEGRSRRRSRKAHRARTQEEVPVTNCGLIVREIAPAACCALLLLLLMLPSVLHVVSSTLRQPPGVLKILIPLKIDRVPGYAVPLSVIVIDGSGSVIILPSSTVKTRDFD